MSQFDMRVNLEIVGILIALTRFSQPLKIACVGGSCIEYEMYVTLLGCSRLQVQDSSVPE